MAEKQEASPKRNLALIYIRESQHRQGDPDESPDRQKARCIRLCEDRGWQYNLFQEPPGHRSGKSEANRPAWQKLKEHLTEPRVVAVVVSRLDRASRSLEDFSRFLSVLGRHGVEFVSVKENFDTTSAMGKAFLRIILILLELEADVDSERAVEMISFKKEKGLTWGVIPFGYDRKKSILSVSSEGVTRDGTSLKDTEALKFVFEGYARGDLSYSGAAKKLNALGFRMKDRRGRRHPFKQVTIRKFIENAMLYAGFVPNGKNWRKGQHTAVIPIELAESIEKMRAQRKLGARGPKPKRPYPLSSVLFCANCGSKLYGAGPINKSHWFYRHFAEKTGKRVCKKGWAQVDAHLVEELVRGQIRLLEVPAEAEELVKRLAKARLALRAGGSGQEAAERIRKFEDQLARAKKLFVAGDFTEEEYESEKKTALDLIAEEQKNLGPTPYNAEDLVAKMKIAGNLIARTEDLAVFKRAVTMLFERVEVKREDSGEWRLAKVIPREEFREFF